MPESRVVEIGPRRRIEVTQEDIDRAMRREGARCVVSKAIARVVKDAVRVETDSQTIRFTQNGQRWSYITPPVVQGYVIDYDAGDDIEPFSFVLSQNIAPKRQIPTEVGKEVSRARNRAQRARTKVATQKARGASKRVVAQAEEEAISVTEAYQEAKRAAKGKPQSKSNGGPKAPPRLFKTGRRTYGGRVMRINRDRFAQVGEFAPRAGK